MVLMVLLLSPICLFLSRRRESKAVSIPDANAKFPAKDGSYGFPHEPAKSRALNVFSRSGQSMHPSVYGSSRKMNLKEEDVLTRLDHGFRSGKSELKKQKSYWHVLVGWTQIFSQEGLHHVGKDRAKGKNGEVVVIGREIKGSNKRRRILTRWRGVTTVLTKPPLRHAARSSLAKRGMRENGKAL
ncbi:serine/threonine-protein kinase isoform X2 [Spatholobus suberectus]|nr:serine/threonine-protein kinase isoform X2 [Spatholobus suberectus]